MHERSESIERLSRKVDQEKKARSLSRGSDRHSFASADNQAYYHEKIKAMKAQHHTELMKLKRKLQHYESEEREPEVIRLTPEGSNEVRLEERLKTERKRVQDKQRVIDRMKKEAEEREEEVKRL